MLSDLTESFGQGLVFQYSAVGSMFFGSAIFYFALAHLLPVFTVGSISLLYAIMNILSAVFIFGLGNGLQHYLSYHLARNDTQAIKKIIVKTTYMAIGLAILAFVTVYYISDYVAVLFFHNIIYAQSVKIIGFAISMSVIINIFASVLLGLNQYKKYSIMYTFYYIILYFFPLLLLFLLKNTISLLYGIAFTDAVYALIFIMMVYRNYFKMPKVNNEKAVREPYKNIIIYSIPLFFASIMNTSATYIDRIVVSYFINLGFLGIYNFALVVASAASIMVLPISNLLIPKLSSFFSLNNLDGFKNSIKMLLNIGYLIYVPAALGIAALSRPILVVFAGDEYSIGYIPLMIIMFITSLFAGTVVLSSGISSVRQTRIFIYSSALSLVANIALSIILIPTFNILGAAISYSSMNAVNFIIVYHYARKFQINNFDRTRILKIWFASIIMFSIVFILQFHLAYSIINILLLILAGFGIYLLEIKAFKLISREEMNYVLDIIPDKFSMLKFILERLSYTNSSSGNDKLFRFIK